MRWFKKLTGWSSYNSDWSVPHISRKNSVITGTIFKLEFIPERAKYTILLHKIFKKSEILVTGKSCIASEAWPKFIWEKSLPPILPKHKNQKKKAMHIVKSTSNLSGPEKSFLKIPFLVSLLKKRMTRTGAFLQTKKSDNWDNFRKHQDGSSSIPECISFKTNQNTTFFNSFAEILSVKNHTCPVMYF